MNLSKQSSNRCGSASITVICLVCGLLLCLIGFKVEALEGQDHKTNVLQPSPEFQLDDPHKMVSKLGNSIMERIDRVSVLKNKYNKAATEFTQQFYTKESRMRAIVREFRTISEEVKTVQESADGVRTGGALAIVAGLGVGLGILAAPFTGGASLAAAAAGTGLAVVTGTNLKKMSSENDSAMTVKALGNEFQEIAEPLKKLLEDIKEICEELEETAAEYRLGNILINIWEYEKIGEQVSELKLQSVEALLATTLSTRTIEGLVKFIVNVFTLTSTPAKDRELRNIITQSAEQGQKVIDECQKVIRFLTIHGLLELSISGALLVPIIIVAIIIIGVIYLCCRTRKKQKQY